MDPQGRPHGDDDRTVPRAPNMPPPTRVSAWAGPPPRGPEGWQPPSPPAKPPRNWMWAVIAATAVIVIASVTVIVVSTTGGDDSANTASTSSSERASTTKASVPKTSTPTTTEVAPPPPKGAVAPDALPGLLLTIPEVTPVFPFPDLKESQVESTLIGGTSPIPQNCVSVWAPAFEDIYQTSGYTGVARRSIRQDPTQSTALVEAVTTFPDAQAAQATRDKVVAAWKGCQSLDFEMDFGGRTIRFKTAAVGDSDGLATMLVFSRSYLDSPNTSTDPNCQRAVTVNRNVVVDLLACTPDVGSAGYSLARDIARKVSAAP